MANAEESQEYICGACPGKGDKTVDNTVIGHCERRKVDSFLQTRRYGIEDPGAYESDEALAELSADALLYFDDESVDDQPDTGNYDAALLGAKCARKVLSGLCELGRDEVLRNSEID